jgi:hypothetical protein
MAAGGLKAGGKIMEGSASALGTFGSAGTALIGAGGVITAAKGVYDLVESGKSLHQATKVKAAAKGAGGKLRTSLGRLWMQRVAERQAVKQKTSVLKGIGAALGIAGAVAAMFTPIGWAIALAGAAIGIGIAAAKIVKKVQDAGAKKQTESIFAKAAPQKQPKEGGPEARPAMHPQQAKAASARAAGAAPGRSLNDAHPLAEPAAAPGGDRAKDAEAGARAAAEAAPVAPAAAAGGPAAAADGQAATYAALSIDPALGFNPAIPATQSPDAVAAKAKVAEKGAHEVIEALESNKQVADGVHEALVTDPRTGEPYDEQRDAAEEDKRSYGNDAGLVVDALQIDKPVAASPSGSLLLQKRMSALDGI